MSLSSAPLNQTVIVLVSFFLAPVPGVQIMGATQINASRKNSEGWGWERRGNILLSPSSFIPLRLARYKKLFPFCNGTTSYIYQLLQHKVPFNLGIFNWNLKNGFQESDEEKEASAGCGIFVKEERE